MIDAGVRTPDLSLEEYASIISATGSGAPLEEALARFGIDTQQFAPLAQRWACG